MEPDTQKQARTPSKKLIGIIVVIAIVLGAGAIYWRASQPFLIGGQKDSHGCLIAAGYSWCAARQDCERPWEQYCTAAAPKVAPFSCDNGKSIIATFYPTDDKYVDLVLSDGRKLSVPHAMSADGARYATSNDTFVFWNVGNTAFVTENGTTTFSGCVTSVK